MKNVLLFCAATFLVGALNASGIIFNSGSTVITSVDVQKVGDDVVLDIGLSHGYYSHGGYSMYFTPGPLELQSGNIFKSEFYVEYWYAGGGYGPVPMVVGPIRGYKQYNFGNLPAGAYEFRIAYAGYTEYFAINFEVLNDGSVTSDFGPPTTHQVTMDLKIPGMRKSELKLYRNDYYHLFMELDFVTLIDYPSSGYTVKFDPLESLGNNRFKTQFNIENPPPGTIVLTALMPAAGVESFELPSPTNGTYYLELRDKRSGTVHVVEFNLLQTGVKKAFIGEKTIPSLPMTYDSQVSHLPASLRDAEADADGDGIKNIIEYLYGWGTIETSNESFTKGATLNVGGEDIAGIKVPMTSPIAMDLNVFVEYSTDLINWSSDGLEQTEFQNGYKTYYKPGQDQCFYRVRVVE